MKPTERFRCPECGYIVYKKDDISYGLVTQELMHTECAKAQPFITQHMKVVPQ